VSAGGVRMLGFQDRVAVVTGAASGIGQALATRLATMGARVAIADVNEAGLRQTADAIQQQGGLASWHVVDVSNREAVNGFADAVIRQYGAVHIVVNNAGVAMSNVSIQNLTYDDLQWVLGVNLWGIVHGTKAFLPHLLAQPHANLVNVSSIYGIAALAKAAPYVTSKFAVRGFSEVLRQELRGTSVAVTVVFPGGIRTNIARSARAAQGEDPIYDREKGKSTFDNQAHTSPEEAARQIADGIRRDAPRVLVGSGAGLLDFMARLLPGTYDGFMLKYVFRRFDGTE
jgi:NAD(P)-dependent dehydrogenase (short-subunit alcohol dehydrogenase family)